MDGLRFSNTFALNECFGWNGLLVEALPENVAKLKINRGKPEQNNILVGDAVCSEVGGTVDFTIDGPDAVNGRPELMADGFRNVFHPVGNVTKVMCNPLWHVFEKHGIQHIDLWSLDVEGGELSVIETGTSPKSTFRLFSWKTQKTRLRTTPLGTEDSKYIAFFTRQATFLLAVSARDLHLTNQRFGSPSNFPKQGQVSCCNCRSRHASMGYCHPPTTHTWVRHGSWRVSSD